LSGKGGVGKSSVTTSLAYVMSNLAGNDGKPLNVCLIIFEFFQDWGKFWCNTQTPAWSNCM